ncbi:MULTISPECIES: pyruvate, phosphate dikinase [unclassified Roseitalea]|uniref:pyruvate, phosphate dikinase n=1 Tax=unclassified Roseitalea TaxID=2639107 RepID=UPI00273D4DE6|nr:MULTISPECIES: pyruvate, phosphate dikinase [unclassified Roseitalea]
MATTNWVYGFAPGRAISACADEALLGGKGAKLAEMSRIDLPVPPGFTITTDACRAYLGGGRRFPEGLADQLAAAIAETEAATSRTFGAGPVPLLVSVRSGARASMPGMMDTVLNLGLNDATVEALAQATGDARFARDSYRRFIQMYATIVMGVEHGLFEDLLDQARERAGVGRDDALGAEALGDLVRAYKKAIADDMDEPFPQDVHAQLWGAIGAVFRSWNNPRAVTYRALHGIDDDACTAVTVQAMVFGNAGPQSATGVAFTRHPSTGEKRVFGEYMVNAQGEDVVAGLRTPDPLLDDDDRPGRAMAEHMPGAFAQLVELGDRLEAHFGDMQDIEFTVENGTLWLLQTRAGKRSVDAAIRIAVDMAREGTITRQQAVLHVDPASLDRLLHPHIDPAAEGQVFASGLPASPGAATGEVVFSSTAAERAVAEGRTVILVRPETSPDDIHGMAVAQGILTTRGGMTSHAAVVARGMGKPAITAAADIRIDLDKRTMRAGPITVREGEHITLDGGTGRALLGALPMVQRPLTGDFAQLMQWADATRRMGVRANVDLADDAQVARRFGAEGIGLVRTENMFLEGTGLEVMREMIMAPDERARRFVLDRLMPLQRDAFVALFEQMPGLPVCIRLLDPPLHEFLPREPAELDAVADRMGIDRAEMRRRADELHETNPMLGNRGARLAICYPEIAEMQTRAIIEAAIVAGKKSGSPVVPEIVVPLVAYYAELRVLRERIDAIAAEVKARHGSDIRHLIGCIVELPRAAIRADLIAGAADFFSFGTNDLTQTTLGISRDDAAHFLSHYLKGGVIERDPFINLDREGVGEVIRMAADKGRAANPELIAGITGEHGGDPESIAFFEELGLDYVSCSPYRVPVARLAAAQAAIRAGAKGGRNKAQTDSRSR